jgi:hypothetical protein
MSVWHGWHLRNHRAGHRPGATHDLTESVRAADPNCGYIRLTIHKVAELIGER